MALSAPLRPSRSSCCLALDRKARRASRRARAAAQADNVTGPSLIPPARFEGTAACRCRCSHRRHDKPNRVPGFRQQLDHSSGIGREHQRCAVLVDGNLSSVRCSSETRRHSRGCRQTGPLLRCRIIQRADTAALGRGLLHAIGARRSRRHWNHEPRADNQHDRGDHAIACACLRSRVELRQIFPATRSKNCIPVYLSRAL